MEGQPVRQRVYVLPTPAKRLTEISKNIRCDLVEVVDGIFHFAVMYDSPKDAEKERKD